MGAANDHTAAGSSQSAKCRPCAEGKGAHAPRQPEAHRTVPSNARGASSTHRWTESACRSGAPGDELTAPTVAPITRAVALGAANKNTMEPLREVLPFGSRDGDRSASDGLRPAEKTEKNGGN